MWKIIIFSRQIENTHENAQGFDAKKKKKIANSATPHHIKRVL